MLLQQLQQQKKAVPPKNPPSKKAPEKETAKTLADTSDKNPKGKETETLATPEEQATRTKDLQEGLEKACLDAGDAAPEEFEGKLAEWLARYTHMYNEFPTTALPPNEAEATVRSAREAHLAAVAQVDAELDAASLQKPHVF